MVGHWPFCIPNSVFGRTKSNLVEQIYYTFLMGVTDNLIKLPTINNKLKFGGTEV